MSKATLVVMAAGIGSRFGTGIKQLEPVGPHGEIIMDYSIHDAIDAGFDKVVFVIRRDLEKDFKEIIGNRVERLVEVAYAYQEVTDIPKKYDYKFPDRKKPWGTGQAILCCKEFVDTPFLVINADDYYGKQAYVKSFEYLTMNKTEANELSMVGFVLENTLSDNGAVTRGICKVNQESLLENINETKNIIKIADGAAIQTDTGCIKLDKHSPVSMNMWGIKPEFFDILEKGFDEFLDQLSEGDLKTEYLLPIIIGRMVEKSILSVKVLNSEDKWFGVTYKEDKYAVMEEIQKLIDAGVYPEKLYQM